MTSLTFVSMFYAMFYKPSSTPIYTALTWTYQCS